MLVKIEFTKEQEQEIRSWINELRTTTKGQANRRLRLGDTFCCLGLYLDSQEETKWTKMYPYALDVNCYAWIEKDSTLYRDEHKICLPSQWSEKLGLNKTCYKLNNHPFNLNSMAMRLNDKCQFTFKQIADEFEHILDTGYVRDELIDTLGWCTSETC